VVITLVELYKRFAHTMTSCVDEECQAMMLRSVCKSNHLLNNASQAPSLNPCLQLFQPPASTLYQLRS